MDIDELEEYMDKVGLAGVLYEIAGICDDKADHIRSSYGNGDADDWEETADAIREFIEDTDLPT